MSSTRYRQLKSEIVQLRRDLLPKRFRRTSQYPHVDVTRTLAYYVLAHAEIEAYLEDRARDTALAAVRAWKDSSRVSKTLVALIGFSGRKMEAPPHSITPEQASQISHWDEKIRLDKKIDSAMNDFHRIVEQNHGIKEENIIRLLLPIGIDCDDLDTVLIADLSSFGKSRGLIAHRPSHYRTMRQIDPRDAEKTVKQLVADMANIDTAVDKLLAVL